MEPIDKIIKSPKEKDKSKKKDVLINVVLENLDAYL